MTADIDDVGIRAQLAAETHLAACWGALYEEEEEVDLRIESPAVGPFCGCDTCQVREVLAGAWPVIEAYFVQERGARPSE